MWYALAKFIIPVYFSDIFQLSVFSLSMFVLKIFCLLSLVNTVAGIGSAVFIVQSIKAITRLENEFYPLDRFTYSLFARILTKILVFY